jgi:hypothetical protein
MDLRTHFKEMKGNIIWGSDEVELRGFNQQALRILQVHQDRLEAELENREGWDEALSKETAVLAKAHAVLLKEGRAIEKEYKQRADSMSMEDRCQVMVKFFKGLPPEYQRRLHQELATIYNEASAKGA